MTNHAEAPHDDVDMTVYVNEHPTAKYICQGPATFWWDRYVIDQDGNAHFYVGDGELCVFQASEIVWMNERMT